MHLFTRSHNRAHQPARRRTQLILDQLENRQLLAGTPYTVTNLNASGTGSLAAEIALANTQLPNPGGSTIQFAPGLAGSTIHLSSTLDLTETDGPEVINGPITLTTDGTATVLQVNTGTTATLDSLIITGGYSTTNGGGIFNTGNLTAYDCTITGNTGNGGGIYNYGTLALTNCNINHNTGDGPLGGGGIYLDWRSAGTATITNSTISNNSASDGGGVYNEDSTLTIINSTISNNTATGQDANSGSVLTPLGGGIYSNGLYGSTTIGITTLINSTIADNTAPTGGGIYVNGGLVTLTNCTVAYNTANSPGGWSGGGIFAYNGYGQTDVSPLPSVVLNNTIVAINTDIDPSVAGNPDDLNGSAVAGSFNLIGDSTGDFTGITNGVNGNQIGVTNLGLGSLANNGGPTQTIALLPGSPASRGQSRPGRGQ